MEYQVTDHAHTVIKLRQIHGRWINEALTGPSLIQPDKTDPALQHYLKAIQENENRVLRVVVNTTVEPPRVVTAFFDRKLKGTL
jgi:hypothetical protein